MSLPYRSNTCQCSGCAAPLEEDFFFSPEGKPICSECHFHRAVESLAPHSNQDANPQQPNFLRLIKRQLGWLALVFCGAGVYALHPSDLWIWGLRGIVFSCFLMSLTSIKRSEG